MNKLYIIIVNYNSNLLLADMIKSLFAKEKQRAKYLRLVIVNNYSSDESFKNVKDFLNKSEYKNKIKMLRNKKNVGFAKACNKGVKYALLKKAKRVLLLNPDVFVEKSFLGSLLKTKYDISSPVIKFRRDEKWVYDFGGRVNWFLGRTSHVERKSPFDKQPSSIDYVSGCCMLVKASVFEKIGFFDEKYFMYFEDVDFCTRAKEKGLQIGVEKNCIIIHKLKEGADKSIFQKKHIIKSNYIFINKYLKNSKIIAYLYLVFLGLKFIIPF